MKLIIIALLFCFSAQASTEECDDQNATEAKSLAQSLGLPNCFTEDSIIEVKNQETDAVCNTCKPKFETIYGKKISKPTKEKLQSDFLDSSIEEYKKSIIDNVLLTLKMRALPSTGDQFPNASTACKMVDEDAFLKNCKSESTKRLVKDKGIIQSLKTAVSNELAKILSTDSAYAPKETLLTRAQSSCFIPEKDLLFASSYTTEEAFTPDIINYFANINPAKINNFQDLFKSPELKAKYNGDLNEFLDFLKKHPYFSVLLDSPTQFVSFFKSIEKPLNTNSLRKALYNGQQGKKLDTDLASRCGDSFRALTEAICSEEFDKGNLTTDPFNNFEKLAISKQKPAESELASSEDLIQMNVNFLSLCEVKNESNSLSLTITNEKISEKMDSAHKKLNLTDFKINKFNSEIGSLNQYLCENKNGTCDIKKLNCQILQKYKKLQDKGSEESKLANSSNKEVNALLRSMIGDPKNLDPKTKEILVQQGILPQEDGSLVAQADIPERRPGYFTQETASSETKVNPAATTTAAKTAAARQNVRPTYDSSSSNFAGQPTSSSASLPDMSEYFKNQKELTDVENEIMRRLSGFPEKRPPTKVVARKNRS